MYEQREKSSDEKKGQITFTVLFYFYYVILAFSVVFQLKKFKPHFSEKYLYVTRTNLQVL